MVGTAAQIVYEYPGWGCEHVSDMYDCIPMPAGYSADDLYDMCYEIQKHKDDGLGYTEAIEAELK